MTRWVMFVGLVLVLGAPRALARQCPEPGAPGARLRVGTSGDYAPFSDGGAGFDVKVARALARELGVELAWVGFRWPELQADLEAGRFDVAMSGVSWRAERALVGYMTRAVAAGGPCVIGPAALGPEARVGVNRGGALEDWARRRFAGVRLIAVDDNRSLPARLAVGELEAIVTDSFELPHFRRPGDTSWCAPPRERKVYWVAPRPQLCGSAAALGRRIDAFVRERERWLDALRARHLGAAAPRDAIDHLVDLLARRLALMPGIAAWKRARGLALEDPGREAQVLERAQRRARDLGLEPGAVRALFELQIELARNVQRRSAPEDGKALDLERARAHVGELGDRIIDALAQDGPPGELPQERLDPLDPWLERSERAQLRAALARLRRVPAAGADGPARD